MDTRTHSLPPFVSDVPPDLFRMQDGTPVRTIEEWESLRRPELLRLFAENVFGVRPVERPASLAFAPVLPDRVMMEGAAIRKSVRASYAGPGGAGHFDLVAFLPIRESAVPAIVFLCNRPKEEHIEPDRTVKSEFWPAEEIVARGFAAIAFHLGSVVPDEADGFDGHLQSLFAKDPADRTDASWGTLSAWAWCASRVMDWLETQPGIDARRVGVAGHSRGGKTALWCAATDERFAMAVSSCSGCGGAKLNRANLPESEHIAQITRTFPHWFCRNYRAFAGRDAETPFDHHALLALVAPRPLYVFSASEDPWAGPPGEFASAFLASPAWERYGKRGLVSGGTLPPDDTPLHEGSIGYHIHAGPHDFTGADWRHVLDFAQAKL
ncbi:MAG: dienelactone hydrolase family protein [Kiritimatiellia bacterium]|jgi:hypothetical protein